ncbi:hypothetical protein ACOSQ2_031281 [Xanthoceras sorbifolium]
MQGDEGIWAKLLRGKYLNNKSLIEVATSKRGASSSVWKSILYGARAVVKGVKWRVGDVCSVDHEGIDMDLKVSHLMTNTGWDIQRLAALLPCHIILRITSMHTGFAGIEADKMIWAWAKDGNFSVKSIYWGLDNCGLSPWGWSFIWSLKLPPKNKFFLWTLLHKKLMTNQQRAVRGLCIEEDCSRCSGTVEGLKHLFRGCPEAITVWESICKGSTRTPSFLGTFDNWIKGNLKDNKKSKFGLPNMLIFAVSLWCIWKWRCSRIFDSNFKTPHMPHLFITGFGRAWWEAINDDGLAKDEIFNLIVWNPPPFGLVKLNVDGSIDCNNSWLGGFTINKGSGSILEAELWGLLEGLKFAWKSGFRAVLVESDSKDVIDLISADANSSHPNFSIIQAYRDMLFANWVCSISHVFREGNRVTDGMAKLGFKLGLNSANFFAAPPLAVLHILHEDCCNVALARVSSY